MFKGTSSLAAIDTARALLDEESSDEDLDAFFKATEARSKAGGGAAKRPAPDADSDEEDNAAMQVDADSGVGADEADAIDVSSASVLRAASLLHVDRHAQQVEQRHFAFVRPDGTCPSLLADLFTSRDDLCVALQHDLLSAWSAKTRGQPVPASVMQQLHELTYLAPDVVLAQAASYCACSVYEKAGNGRQPTLWRPALADVSRALHYFGADALLLDDAAPTAAAAAAAATTTAAASAAAAPAPLVLAEPRFDRLSDWLRFVAAAYNQAQPGDHAQSQAESRDAARVFRSLLLLGADGLVQSRHRQACFSAVNAALSFCLRASAASAAAAAVPQAPPAVVQEILASLVAFPPAQLSTLSLAHMSSFLGLGHTQANASTATAPAAVAALFAGLALRRFCSSENGDALPYAGTLEVPQGGRVVPVTIPSIVAAVLAVQRGIRVNTKTRGSYSNGNGSGGDGDLSPLMRGLASLYSLTALLHALSAAQGRTWSGLAVTSLKDGCEGLRLALEESVLRAAPAAAAALSKPAQGQEMEGHAARDVKAVLELLDALLDHLQARTQATY